MLLKDSFKAVFILIATASAGSAQAPLWFETTPSTAVASTKSDTKLPSASKQAPSGPQQSTATQNTIPWLKTIPWDNTLKQTPPATQSPKWIEANKVLANPQTPQQQTSQPSQKAVATPPLLESKTPETSRTTTDAKAVTADKAAKKPEVDAPIAATPWSAALQASQQTPTVATKPKSLESADDFIKRAETQLKLQERPEQIAAPKLPVPNRDSLATSKPAEPASREVDSISTKLSSRALQSGEIEHAFSWPNQAPAAPSKPELAAAAFTEANSASEESLSPSVQTTLAIWQEQEASRSDKKADEGEDVPSSKDDDSDASSESAKTAKNSKKPEKFNTDSMIGPMSNTQKLFSMLEVQDQFQGYAEPVNAGRTRDLDSPMHAPYTLENYTWISPVFYHKPLYFEQPNLERYGQGTYRFLQPAASSIHFFGTIPLLPYKVLTQHPCEKHYTLGNRRPGNCNPVQRRVVLGQSTVGEVREFYREGSGY